MSEQKRQLFELLGKSKLAKHCYLVGGSLRDEQLGIDSADYDFAIEQENGAKAITHELHESFPELFSTPYQMGAQYPIWQITWKNLDLQFADTHREHYPDKASRQRELHFAPLNEDCRRRDFTINMLYQRVSNKELLDPSGAAIVDIESRTLRTHPLEGSSQIFFEDPLRIVRMLRFMSTLEMKADAELLKGAQDQKERLDVVSVERIRDEFLKVLHKGALKSFMESTLSLNLLENLFPELLPMIGCTQDKIYHAEGDVWVHTMMVIEQAPKSPLLQLSALLHDIGKPQTRTEHGERVKFLGHETLSADMAKEFLDKRKFSKTLTSDVEKLVRLHLRGSDCSKWKGLKAARRFVRDSEPLTEELIQLIEADSHASLSSNGSPRLEHIALLRNFVKEANRIPISQKPILNGREIISALGIEPGPIIGEIHTKLQDLSDEYAEKGQALSKEQALDWLKDKQKEN